ncbi:MAG: TlpA disulfide reductase family protein, partial [Chitinophagaceae bacterium]
MNNLSHWGQRLKKNWVTIVLLLILSLFIFNPNAKPWLLRQLISFGFFNIDLKKDRPTETVELTFMNEDGRVIATKDLLGKVIFINFWASWCPPCRAEMPSINSLYQKVKIDTNIVFVMVALDDDFRKAQTYQQQHIPDLPVFRIAGSVPTNLYNGVLPTTLIIDKSGKLLLQH